jgi:Flp pilus assembly protein TadD
VLELLQQAVRHLEARRFAAAEASCRAFLAQHPQSVEARLVQGLALGALGQAADAAEILHLAAGARPEAPHPSHALSGLLRSLDRKNEVARQYAACLALAPENDSIRVALAEHLYGDGDAASCLCALQPLLQSAPDRLEARILAGMAQSDLGNFADALTNFRAAVRIAPDEAVGWTNLALTLSVEGQFAEAEIAASRAVTVRPDLAQIRLNRAIILLRAGRLAEAWPDYDARLLLPGRGPLPPDRLLADIDAVPAAAGLTVLVVHEDGFGDSLQFIRYAALLAERGMRVLAWVPKTLAALVGRVPGVAAVVECGAPIPPYDLHCHITDLPRVFGTTWETIPGAPYLHPDPVAVSGWAAKLPPRNGFSLRVGLSWAGQARPWMPGFNVLDARRSMALADLSPLAGMTGVQWISLQKGPAAAQVRNPPNGMVLYDLMEAAKTFDDTAALIANLDVVVSVDTSILHVAGGMGVPVLLLDRYDSCWRWFFGREDSPWYPSLRILRQQRAGDWAPVMPRAAAALHALAEPRRAVPVSA